MTPIVQQGNRIYLTVGRDIYWYDITSRPLGSGAMGTVFLGRNLNNNHDLVAIKLVKSEYASIPTVRRRARQEGSLQYGHNHLIEMLGYCENHPVEGPLFIVSKYIRGITLDDHVVDNLNHLPDRINKIIATAFPVLEALSYLHKKNIVHLDIKPSNIMVETGNCNIRLMDLGICNVRSATEITSAGILGTPGYAAPEQYVKPGEPLDIDPRTDLYELAVTYYELLGGDKSLTNRQGDDNPPAIPGVPKPIMQVLYKALRKSRDDRYPSADAMIAALRNALAPPRPWYVRLFQS